MDEVAKMLLYCAMETRRIAERLGDRRGRESQTSPARMPASALKAELFEQNHRGNC
jgi:hypothetical protein